MQWIRNTRRNLFGGKYAKKCVNYFDNVYIPYLVKFIGKVLNKSFVIILNEGKKENYSR